MLLADQTELPDDGRWRQLVRERCDPVVKRTWAAGSTWTAGSGSRQAVARQVEPGRPGAALRAAERVTVGGAVPDGGQGRRAGPVGGARPGHLPGDRRAHDRRPGRLRGPHAVEAVGSSTSRRSSTTTSSWPSTRRTSTCRPSARRSPPRTRAAATSSARRSSPCTGTTSPRTLDGGHPPGELHLAALLPDRSGFAPVTGSVRGPVTVGDTPAPPATDAGARVPAQVPPVEPALIPGTRPPSPCRVRHPRRRARTRRRSTVRRNRRPPTTTRPRPIRSRSSRSRLRRPGPDTGLAPAPAPDLGSLVGGGY